MPTVIIPPTDVSPNTGTGTAAVLNNSPTLVTPISATLTGPASTNLTLAGGSSGASLVLGQGATGNAALSGGLGNLTISTADNTSRGLTITDAQGKTIQLSPSFGATGLPGIGTGTNDALTVRTNAVERMRVSNTGNLLIGGTTDITGSGGLKVFGTTDRDFGTFGTGSFSTLGGASITKSLQVGFGSGDTFTVAAYGTSGSSILAIGGGAAAKVQAFLSGSATSLQLNPLGGAVSVGTTATVVTLNGTTASTSTTTGALTVAGGLGVAGAAYVGGAIIASGGSAAAPSVAIGSTDNGFYLNGTDNIGMALNGALALNMDQGTGRFDLQSGYVFRALGTGEHRFGTTNTVTMTAGVLATTGAATFGGAIAIGNTVNTVSPTSPNRTITIVVGGTTYYIAAKTTND
jgi:hypothetical protein